MSRPRGWIIPKRIVHESGVRGGALADVQLICGAGPYEVDILVREHQVPSRLEIVGQITLGGRIHEPVSGLQIELVDSGKSTTAGDTRTDGFGEFDLESNDKRRTYGLRLGAEAEAPCVLVWEQIPPA